MNSVTHCFTTCNLSIRTEHTKNLYSISDTSIGLYTSDNMRFAVCRTKCTESASDSECEQCTFHEDSYVFNEIWWWCGVMWCDVVWCSGWSRRGGVDLVRVQWCQWQVLISLKSHQYKVGGDWEAPVGMRLTISQSVQYVYVLLYGCCTDTVICIFWYKYSKFRSDCFRASSSILNLFWFILSFPLTRGAHFFWHPQKREREIQ